MHTRRIGIVAAVGLLALPALASGKTTHLRATGVRIGDHPTYVRIVVDFSGKISNRDVEGGPARQTIAIAQLNRPGVTTKTNGKAGAGVHVTLQPGTQSLHIAMTYEPRRLKYLAYHVVSGTHLAIDLWKSAPPAKPSHTCSGLTLRKVHVTKNGTVVVRGHEHGIFENQFQVVVRGKNGAVLGKNASVHGPGAWSTTVAYDAPQKQTGTVEAVALSAKDGSLECLAQQRVTLPST
ncbi:MAG TPA: Gmad2 immunoglobulin-like domain-containing protein [Gaiellaceae bacterium]